MIATAQCTLRHWCIQTPIKMLFILTVHFHSFLPHLYNLRDCPQITLVTLNGFCLLSKPQKRVFFEFFLLLGLVFQVLKVCLTKIFKIELPDLLFFVVFISFYISRYHFSQIFRASFRIILKKDFCHKFSYLTDSHKPSLPTPLMAKIH